MGATDFVPNVFCAEWQNRVINMSPLDSNAHTLHTTGTRPKSLSLERLSMETLGNTEITVWCFQQ